MSRRSTVLAYHGVGVPPPGEDRFNLFVHPDRFAEQMDFLARRRPVSPLADVVAGTAPAGAVALTFDDGYRHLLETAVPVLERHGLPATVFVPSAHVGGRNTWDPPSACDLDVMDAAELREADRRGLRVESHGHTHLDCLTADEGTVEDDLRASQERLADLVGRRPRFLAWPFRDGSPQARRVAERLGFEAAFSIDLPDDGRFSAGRVQVTPGDGARSFAAKTSGRYLAVRHHRLLAAAYRAVKPGLRR